MKLKQIKIRQLWAGALAASMLFSCSVGIAQANDGIDPAYQLDSQYFAQLGFDLKDNTAAFPLKRNSQGHWAIDTKGLFVLDKIPASGVPRISTHIDAPFNVIQRRMFGFYEKQAYQQGFDEVISFVRAMHAQGIGLELHYDGEYESPYANVMIEKYRLRLAYIESNHGRHLSSVSIPWHIPKVKHINPRSALSISQVNDAPVQGSR